MRWRDEGDSGGGSASLHTLLKAMLRSSATVRIEADDPPLTLTL